MALTSPRDGATPARGVPNIYGGVQDTAAQEVFRRVIQAINSLFDGKVNSTGSVTLTASSTTTTLSDKRIGKSSVVLLSPKTANAAGALATTYVSAVTEAQATLTHASNSQTDRTFAYAVFG